MARNEERGITRRTVFGGMAASAALGLAGASFAADGPTPDREALQHLVAALDDVPTEKFDWGTLKWLISGEISPGAAQTVGIAQILPGKGNPVHYHPNCEEVLYVISGRGVHSLGDKKVELGPGMAIRIPQDVRHNMVNTGWETIISLVTFSSGERQAVFLK